MFTRITSRFLFLLLFCCGCKISFEQPDFKIDSLLSALKTANEDTGKVNLLNSLSQHLWRAARYSIAIEICQGRVIIG